MQARHTFTLFALSMLGASASAQKTMQSQPITSPLKNAGTYHMSTGSWTRGASPVALAGPEVIYDNTCATGISVPPAGTVVVDSGRLPSTNSPSGSMSLTGLYDDYLVNGFTIAYCSVTPNQTSFTMAFYDCYAACDAGPLPSPVAGFAIVNAPAGTAGGTQACWIATFDLQNTTFSFNLGGDCDGVYDNVASTDSFAWSWVETTPGNGTALVIAGDPLGLLNASCGGIGGGTTFPTAGPGPGTGIGQLDQVEGVGGVQGCLAFGGYSATNPWAGFYLVLRGDQGNVPPSPGTAYCFGDGSGAVCPCAAFAGAGEGCLNTTGTGGAALTGSGVASLGADTFQLDVVGVPGNKPGLILRGANQIASPAGDGILCAAGQAARSQVQVTSGGSTTFTQFLGGGFGAMSYGVGTTTNYQFWYRDAGNTCSGGGFNFSNGWATPWQP